MHAEYLTGIVDAALLMAGCNSSNELSVVSQDVCIMDRRSGVECQLVGTATGKQSNWLSGQHGGKGGSMCGATNDLCNQAAVMDDNVIYDINSPSQGMLSSFVLTDSQIIGQVYKCLNWCDPEAGQRAYHCLMRSAYQALYYPSNAEKIGQFSPPAVHVPYRALGSNPLHRFIQRTALLSRR